MLPVFPANDFDNPEKLLSLLGSFWLNTYQGSIPVRDLLHSRARLDAQTHLEILDLVASMSRFTVPVFKKKSWYFLQILESEANKTADNLAKFDGTYSFTESSLQWGIPAATEFFVWNLPAELHGVKVITNRITQPSRTLLLGIDFFLRNNTIIFKTNPFADELIATRDIFEDNTVVDREAGLWLYRGDFDLQIVYQQFGYVLEMQLASSESYKRLVNTTFSALVDGGCQGSIDEVFAAISGVSLTKENNEVVERVFQDSRAQWVVTDRYAYKFHKNAVPIVTRGDVLRKGQPLTNTLTFYEFGRGQTYADLKALSVGSGFLAHGFFGDLVFENKEVPVVVEEDVDGYTKVSFALGGRPDDVIKFWDDVHTSGVFRQETLANLLDSRPEESRTTQPTAQALPQVINPLEFLTQNLFRNNLYVVAVRPGTFGEDRLGLPAASVLRKVVPPHTAVIVLVVLATADEPVILSEPGDDAKPGAEESLGSYTAIHRDDTINAPGNIRERVRCRQLGNGCT